MPFIWIDPIAVSIGPLNIHWYGLMYVLGFVGGYFFLFWLIRKKVLRLTVDELDALVFYVFMGLLIGARLGYVLFYNIQYYLAHPVEIIAVWDGGLSYHGGLIGVIFSGLLYCRKFKKSFLYLADFVIIVATFGMFLGRIGNFINAELYGKPTTLPWGVLFPGETVKRHPSQLYEAVKNLIFFCSTAPLAIFGTFQKSNYKSGLIFWIFLVYYGVVRFFIEFLREPDAHIGYIAFQWLTVGQLLCVIVALTGLFGLYRYFFSSRKE